MIASLALHYCLGLTGAGVGWWARGFCRHTSHRVILTLSMIGVEAVATVGIIG